ncbi:hypothetical protein BVRB_6g147480 [Beta vulgaris subsp. vulgaris]|nr:hypothetical protein BVRB_6g147480 [Beta vulgaris subsp. vulgaris]
MILGARDYGFSCEYYALNGVFSIWLRRANELRR